jgi:hypothetical protein
LALVRLNSTQTTISMADDIVNRRMVWSDVDSFTGSGGAWPYDNIITVSTTNADADYTTIAAAITAASAGDAILLDTETFTEAITVNKNVGIYGLGATLTNSAAATLTITSDCTVYGLTILNSAGGSQADCVLVSAAVTPILDKCIINKASGSPTIGAGVHLTSGASIELRDCQTLCSVGTAGYGIYPESFVTLTISGGYIAGSTLDIYSDDATSTINFFNTPALSAGLSVVSPTINGVYTAANVLTIPNTSGLTGGVWLHKADGNRIFYWLLADAISAAASSGDTIKIYASTINLGSIAHLTVNKSVTIEGEGAETIITSGENSAPTIDITADNVTLRNLTIKHTGAGTTAGCVGTDNTGVVLENCILTKSSGAASVSYGFWMYGAGSARLTNCRIANTAGTTKRGIMTTLGAGTVTVEGGQVGGDTADLYSDQAGAAITLNDPILTNASKDWAGTVRGEAFDTYGRRLRLKPAGINGGRITLTSGTPVTTSDVTAATTIYYTPYNRSRIEVYNGSFWLESPFAEVSLSLSGFTADKNSDVWIYDNAGTLALERTEWTNDTTRATALAVQDGRYCKSGTLTRLYVGTFRTTGTTGQTEDSTLKRFVWNNYNRAEKSLRQTYSATHTYNIATWRPFNNSAANSQVVCVLGVLEDAFIIMMAQYIAYASGNSLPYISTGINSTSTPTTLWSVQIIVGGTYIWSNGVVYGQAGYNTLCPLEYSAAGGTAPSWEVSEIDVAIKC